MHFQGAQCCLAGMAAYFLLGMTEEEFLGVITMAI